MKEEEFILHKARFSFGTFMVFMTMAGIIISIVTMVFEELFTIWKLVAGDPSINLSSFLEPIRGIIIGPLDAIICGIIGYPIYKYIVNRYFKIKMKFYKTI